METKEPIQLTRYSPDYNALIQAGPRLEPLRRVHARIIVSGSHRSRALVTKLLTLACAAGSIGYTSRLLISAHDPDQFLFNSLLKASSSAGFSLHTLLFYRRMLLSRIPPSSYTFTSLIKSCADISSVHLGESVHALALVSGLGSDRFVQAGLVSLYSKSGEVGVARKVFDTMSERTVVAWNTMISGYERNGCPREAIALFHEMRGAGVDLDSATLVSVLSACSQLGMLSLGSWVEGYAAERGIGVDVVLGASLINMYGKCGAAEEAQRVFEALGEEERNVVAWTAVISARGARGEGRLALDLFGRMKARGTRPNSVTFVAVLSACAHSGLVEEGREVYESMVREFGIVPGLEHHVCMVDMLGRAGRLGEAHYFVRTLESPGPAVWTAMLGACRLHKAIDLGLEVAERVMKSEPGNPGHYVVLSNIYAQAGMMDRVETVRNKMVWRRLKKEVGYSAVEVDQRPYLFKPGDKSWPESVEIYQFLDQLMQRCKDSGYVPDQSPVLHELEEEEREMALRYHSERLAVAFGLMKTSPGTVIRVVKNLRICEDCHLAFKYISAVESREIVVRDRLRFHRFKDGSCSCLDYW